MKKGFTLIELLVVVLIIGILSAVAMPQYQKSVEKSRLSEVMMNLRTIREAYEFYQLENPGGTGTFKEFATVELSGGNWEEETTYSTKNFRYDFFVDGVEVYRNNDDYSLVLRKSGGYAACAGKPEGEWCKGCYTHETDVGKNICSSLKSSDFAYVEGEL